MRGGAGKWVRGPAGRTPPRVESNRGRQAAPPTRGYRGSCEMMIVQLAFPYARSNALCGDNSYESRRLRRQPGWDKEEAAGEDPLLSQVTTRSKGVYSISSALTLLNSHSALVALNPLVIRSSSALLHQPPTSPVHCHESSHLPRLSRHDDLHPLVRPGERGMDTIPIGGGGSFRRDAGELMRRGGWWRRGRGQLELMKGVVARRRRWPSRRNPRAKTCRPLLVLDHIAAPPLNFTRPDSASPRSDGHCC